MSIATRNLREDVTHWPVTGSDGYGGFTFGTPIKLKGRWEEKQELFLTLDNEEEVSKAIVYLNADVAEGDYLGQGDQTTEADPTASTADAHRLRQYDKVTDLRALNALRKAWL
jgi:hypothetical protein